MSIKTKVQEWAQSIVDGKRHNKNGEEVLDPTPLSVPVGFHHPPSIEERVARMVRFQMSEYAQANGQESFEDADDFDVQEDYDFQSPYEEHFDHHKNLEELKTQIQTNKTRKSQPKQDSGTASAVPSKPSVDPKQDSGTASAVPSKPSVN